MNGLYSFDYTYDGEEEKKECDRADDLVSRMEAEARAAFLAAEALALAVEARKAAAKVKEMKEAIRASREKESASDLLKNNQTQLAIQRAQLSSQH